MHEVKATNNNYEIKNQFDVTEDIIIECIFNILDETKPGLNGEIQLTDAIRSFLSNDSVFAYEFQGSRFDCGSKEGYVSAIVDRASHLENFREIVKK